MKSTPYYSTYDLAVYKYAIITAHNVYMAQSSTNDINLDDLEIDEEYMLTKICIPLRHEPNYVFDNNNKYNDLKILSSNKSKDSYWNYGGIIDSLYSMVHRWKSVYVFDYFRNISVNMKDGETYYIFNGYNIDLKGKSFVNIYNCDTVRINGQSVADINSCENVNIRNTKNFITYKSNNINIMDSDGRIDGCDNVKISSGCNVNAYDSTRIKYGGDSKGIIDKCKYVRINSKSDICVRNSEQVNITGHNSHHKIYNSTVVSVCGKGKSIVDMYNVRKMYASGNSNIINIYDYCDGYISHGTIANILGNCNIRSITRNIYVYAADSNIEAYNNTKINVHRYAKINSDNIQKHDTSKRIIRDTVPGIYPDIIGIGGTIHVYGYSNITCYDNAVVNTFCDCD